VLAVSVPGETSTRQAVRVEAEATRAAEAEVVGRGLDVLAMVSAVVPVAAPPLVLEGEVEVRVELVELGGQLLVSGLVA
jgi:phage baseplate assembly protein gpV